MTTSPTNAAYRDLLVEMSNWREERRISNVKFYSDRITLIQPAQKAFTVRKATCDICLKPQDPGIRNLFLTGTGSHQFHVCEACWNEITQAAALPLLVSNQTEVTLTHP